MNITYLEGDATVPLLHEGQAGTVVIAHVCNNVGAWGAGFVTSLSRRWPSAYYGFRSATLDRHNQLGRTDLVVLDPGPPRVYAANMFAQDGIRNRPGPKAVGTRCLQYDALEECLHWLGDYADVLHPDAYPFVVQMPRIGAGLAGGDWKQIEAIIEKTLCKATRIASVNVFDL